ncbi:ABC transporter substrate-binding protein [Ancylobacter sp. MQZ15Z-1]|uniref:ABC transporter substrate-binding protein n=1 Tax=Ancylobacter mangrovi TaxID=2972472 RepID=A0A9X2PJF4_9HYPH|nr:ABC transporter substrate-binding protein [Ancylobacter mangrovi]MCS0496277.1 ABC transporter substrate-binding protein [Ancylobacter mangrovi]
MAALALAAALLPAPTPAKADELKTVNVIMPLPRSANFYPIVAGEALGYFADEGIEVNLLPSSTTVPYVAFVQNGQAELAMLDAPQTFQAVQAGIKIKVIYEAHQKAPEGVAVLADSPYKSVVDLKGKTVGLVSDRDLVTLTIALNHKGVPISDVHTVVVGEAGPTMASALKSGRVVAIAGATPDWLSLEAAGMDIRLITPTEMEDQPANSFVVSADRMDELRKTLEGFFRAYSKGMEVAKIDPQVLSAMLKKAVPEEWPNEEFGQKFVDASVDLAYSITDKKGDVQAEVWKAVQPPLVKVGELKAEIDPATFLDASIIGPANDYSRDEIVADVAAWKQKNM